MSSLSLLHTLAWLLAAEDQAISGVIYDRVSMRPIPDVRIESHDLSSSSERDGRFRFSFSGQKHSLNRLSLSKEGYLRTSIVVDHHGRPEELMIPMEPSLAVTGRLSHSAIDSSNGFQLQLKTVWLLNQSESGVAFRLPESQALEVRPGGVFQFGGLDIGAYTLIATGARTLDGFVGEYSKLLSEPLKLRPGESGVVSAVSSATSAVSGHAFTVRGKLAASWADSLAVRVLLVHSEIPSIVVSQTAPSHSGRFEFPGVIPGTYTILVEGVSSVGTFGRREITVADSDIDLDGFEAIPLSKVRIRSGLGNRDCRMPELKVTVMEPWLSTLGRFDLRSGEERAVELPPGRYVVKPSASRYFEASCVVRPFVFEAPASGVVAVPAESPGSLKVQITGAKPHQGIVVRLVGPTVVLLCLRTNAAGDTQSVISGVEAGDYTVSTVGDTLLREWRSQIEAGIENTIRLDLTLTVRSPL